MFIRVPVVASHNRTVWSDPPLASVEPSGLYAILRTPYVCPVSVFMRVPVVASHKRTVPSAIPLARVVPSGLYAILWTHLLCPPISATSAPVLASYTQIPMLLPTASRLPSGEYAISLIVPLPRRALAPSGKCHCGESWALLVVMFRVNTRNRTIRKEIKVLIFMGILILSKFSFVSGTGKRPVPTFQIRHQL